MKQEERASLPDEITWNQEKLKSLHHKIDNCLDRFIDLYAQAKRAVQEGQNHQQALTTLDKDLLTLRPIKTVREHFMHHYRKLSNLIHRMQLPSLKNGIANSRYSRRGTSEQANNLAEMRESEQKFNRFFKKYLSKSEDYSLLEEMIVENFIRRGEWECSKVWEGVEEEVDGAGLFRESISLREGIREGRLLQAIQWCQQQRLYQTHECYLEYELKLMHLLGLIRAGQSEKVLPYYMTSFTKFFSTKKEEVEKLCLHIFFKLNNFWDTSEGDEAFQQKIDDRYRIFEYSQEKLGKLASAFFEQYLKHYNLSRFNSLEVIFNCSQSIMEEYLKMMKLIWANREGEREKELAILPFSVNLSREFQYHSLFYCPITKEVHSSNQASKLLPCGHLISQNAHNRIVQENRNRRKIKCPICQKDIRPEESLKTEF